ncbi:MAG: DNA polymerase IV [Akkermansiaceae bacterium]|nr:DNA polymerase IV [Akkermansiaceae bacterium]
MSEQRKIIHIDMDCFYAAVEERDQPELRGKPLAVAGSSRRSVLTTANYEARKYGCRSAMPLFKALELCPHLVVVPVRSDVYREESARIHGIFGRFTELIEPISLDEAYLDVSHLRSSAAAVAGEIRAQIEEETGLTASAGVSCNKLVAKIASGWNKPNAQTVVMEEEIAAFMEKLPVTELWGVGRKMHGKLQSLGVETCGDLQHIEKVELARRFGKWGIELWHLCRGEDDRPVRRDRIRKSISSETTFRENVTKPDALVPTLREMLGSLADDIRRKHAERQIKSLVVKLKFEDFKRTTAERGNPDLDEAIYRELLNEAWKRGHGKAVRLFGIGARFADPIEDPQLELFE